jgi:four helix bundle protein
MNYFRRKKPDGFKELLVYRRAEELHDYVYKITENFLYKESRRRVHMRDCGRSVKQNIVEGWKRETTKQYIDFLSFSFGSLGELKEDGNDCIKLGVINQQQYQELMQRCGEIDYLMGRLKMSLENKMGNDKNDFLSPFQQWKGKQQNDNFKKHFEADEELRKIVEEEKAKGVKGA